MKIILNLILVILFSTTAFAAHYIDRGSHLWNDPSNWLDGVVPIATDTVNFVAWMGSPEVCNIISGDNAVGDYIFVGYSTNVIDTTLNVTGTGTLTANDLRVSFSDHFATGHLNVSDDAIVNVTKVLFIGQNGPATLTLTGNAQVTTVELDNTMTTYFPEGTGHIQLNGGILHVTTTIYWDDKGTMDVNGGTFKVPYSYRGPVEGWIAEGKITAKGKTGLDKFKMDTDNSSYWTFEAVPDPNIAQCVSPPNGASRIPTSTIFRWLSGCNANAHNVFLGTDKEEVANASAVYMQGDLNKDGKVDLLDITNLVEHWLESGDGGTDLVDFALLAKNWLTETIIKGQLFTDSYAVSGLENGQTYYWRIDEVNESLPESPWKGPVWKFSTPDGVAESVYYVSTTGNYNNPGTYTQPFDSLEKARDVLRQKALPDGGVTVYLRGGNYYRTMSFTLASSDSGEPNKPIVYKTYPGEQARIIGGIAVDPSWFTLATSTSPTSTIYNRIDPNARGHVYWMNLTTHGITNCGTLVDRGYNVGDNVNSAMELSFNGQMMRLARWPNPDAPWARTVSGVSSTSFIYSGTRPSRWKVTDELWLHGYWDYGWIDRHTKVTSLITSTSTISWTPDLSTVIGSNMPWYVYNSLEEIDQPGEWYHNPTGTVRLYFWPPAPLAGSEILLSMMNDPLVKMEGASYINFDGLIFESGRGKGIVIIGGTQNHILNSTVRNMGSTGISVAENNSSIENCQIYDLGNSGIVISGGDRVSLLSSNNLISNCRIYKYGRFGQTYHNAGIFINSACGITVRNNTIYDGPGQAIVFYGNNNLIELNEFYDVCKNVGDAGVIYDGQGWANRGNIIRNNFFHNNKSDLFGTGAIQAIYFDDVTSGNAVFGNLFYQIDGQATFNGGGHYNTYQNNVIAKNHIAHHADRRGATWFDDSRMVGYKDEVISYNYTLPPWSTSYPELITVLNLPWAQAKEPQGVSFASNIGWQNTTWTEGDGFGYYTWGTNISNQDPLFYDEANLILALKDNSPAYSIPGFQRVPWEKMGNLSLTKAIRPIPPNGWGTSPVSVNLYWAPASTAVSRRVYLSTNTDPRLDGYRGIFTDSSYIPATLLHSTTYYWCVDEYDSNGNLLGVGDIWSFTTD